MSIVKPYDILRVENTLEKSLYYVAESICHVNL